eukprot:CAMPEP_0117655230 /NCGR_PEP_ID=MMETSP0804-20121206/4170_1 /TAXON_ID=1074897 /ORGANISM="Tetraselmis astigmatica, Strain CCMP880" /LENGTH=310 /DNA_ID=CAMNT_0005461571 /DNA_START=142 /DNA_END=1074 /DNA_ORIENTATION=-
MASILCFSSSTCIASLPSLARLERGPSSSPASLVHFNHKLAAYRVFLKPSNGHSQGRLSAVRPVSASRDEVFGMDTSDGLFGFSPFAELWVGRLAMLGFLTSVVQEAITGQGTLQQIGFDAPSPALLGLLLAVFGGATLVGSANTLRQAQAGNLPRSQLQRFRALFGLQDEQDNIAASEAKLKGSNDPVRAAFTDDEEAISAAKAAGTPADEFLTFKDGAEAIADELKRPASQPQGPSVCLAAKQDIMEQTQFSSAEMEYAKSVEMRNGRWAMVGFLAAVLVEAGTGHGILMQLIDWCKIVGLLGSESGF